MADDAGPSEVEKSIGVRLKLMRKEKKLTQKDLAQLLDVKFQQVQKYENGTNRISASRLHHITKVLNVNWNYFFPATSQTSKDSAYAHGFGETKQAPIIEDNADEQRARQVLDFLETNDGLRLNIAFAQIKDSAQRKSIIAMAETLAKSD